MSYYESVEIIILRGSRRQWPRSCCQTISALYFCPIMVLSPANSLNFSRECRASNHGLILRFFHRSLAAHAKVHAPAYHACCGNFL